jgi:hypothetical protein
VNISTDVIDIFTMSNNAIGWGVVIGFLCMIVFFNQPPKPQNAVIVAAPPTPALPKTPIELKLEKLQTESDRACDALKYAMELPQAEQSKFNLSTLSDLCSYAVKDLESFKKHGY